MAIIRTQDKVPTVYTWESRDFQLLARLFDTSFNGVKYDIDSMLGILDAAKCRSNILQLLQTKIGFFSNRDIEDDTLRYILQSFPSLIKAKGSIKAVQEAINTFLKAYNITAEINIWYVNNSEVVYNTEVSDHTIIIGLNKALSNMYILEEIFKYILPTGFGFYMYFYNTVADMQEFAFRTQAKLLYASDNISSMLRSADASDNFINRTLGGFDVTEIASSDSPLMTTSGTYEPGDTSMFLGILTAEPLVSTDNYCYIKISSNASAGYQLYYRYNSKWNLITYKGAVKEAPEKSNGISWTIINDAITLSNAQTDITVSLDATVFENKIGRQSKKYKYSMDEQSWIDLSDNKPVNLIDLGINLDLHEEVLSGIEIIEVFKNVTDNSIISNDHICNHYIWFSGLTQPLNTKCLYDLYKTVNKED